MISLLFSLWGLLKCKPVVRKIQEEDSFNGEPGDEANSATYPGFVVYSATCPGVVLYSATYPGVVVYSATCPGVILYSATYCMLGKQDMCIGSHGCHGSGCKCWAQFVNRYNSALRIL